MEPVHILGNELAAFESSKDFTSLLCASADITDGATCSARGQPAPRRLSSHD